MKHYMILSGIVGGIVGSLLTALLVSPVTAQRDKFGDIECTSLSVVNPATGKATIELAHNGLGGEINISDLTGHRQVSLVGTGILNGLNIFGRSGEPVVAAISDGSGGLITVTNDIGSATGKTAAGMAASKNGTRGILEIYVNTGTAVITLKVTEYGSLASFDNKAHNTGVAIASGVKTGNSSGIVVFDGASNPIASLP